MDTTALLVYRQEIQRLLMSMTIKYTPLSDLYNQNLKLKGYPVDDRDPLSWKYYVNLQGLYHVSDTPMHIRSLDTGKTVLFSKETLATHRATRDAYVPGDPFYQDILNRFPEQADLIKSIVYPVEDIGHALEAPDLTLLQYDRTILDELEQSLLIQDLITHLDYIRSRWYQLFLDHEIYYTLAFWGSLWQNITGALFTFRTTYIRTAFAHDFHVQAYLESRGIDVFQGVLTRDQIMFLYRNIDFILANRGKQSTLDILARNLLSEDALGLVNKTIRQNTVESESNDCRWTPEFVSGVIPNNYQDLSISLPIESMRDINSKLVNAGHEVDVSDAHIEAQTKRIGSTTFNDLPTKILEIKKFDQNNNKERLIWNFLIDTLFYNLSQGHHRPALRVQDDVTGLTLKLSGHDAVFFLHYAIHRVLKETPKNLPTHHIPFFTYKEDVTSDMIPTSFMFDGYRYPTKQFLDRDKWVENAQYPSRPIVNSKRFVNHMAKMFGQFLHQYQLSQTTSSSLTQHAYQLAFQAITKHTPIPLNPPVTSYDTWIQKNNNIQTIVETYEASSKTQVFYEKLAEKLFDNLLPTTEALSDYVDLNRDITKYRLLTDIFRQLTSYNVAFLNSNRENQIWAGLSKTSYHVHALTVSFTDYMHNDIPITYTHRDTHHLNYFLKDTRFDLEAIGSCDLDHDPSSSFAWCDLHHTHILHHLSAIDHMVTSTHHDTQIPYGIGSTMTITDDSPNP